MSGKTLDYGSVEKWVSLSVWAADAYERWNADRELLGHSRDDAWYITVFHSIAQEALNRGFSLRVGNRAIALYGLLLAIAPKDVELLATHVRIDKETWLTTPGERKQSHD